MLRRKFVGFPSLFTVLRLSIFGWQALRLLAFHLGGRLVVAALYGGLA